MRPVERLSRAARWAIPGLAVLALGLLLLPGSPGESPPDRTTTTVASTTVPPATSTPTTVPTTTTNPAPEEGSEAGIVVSISGERFLIDGTVTYPGTAIEGLLMNARTVQAAFDDENPETVGRWAYPDTGRWDPERNTEEFLAALPLYAAHGLRAVTVNLQGGNPDPAPGVDDQPWVVTAYQPDGSLKPAWLARLDRVIRAADREGMVVILGYFYFGQDHRLEDQDAVLRAADEVTGWLLEQGYTNVLVEVNNESNSKYDHPILRPAGVHRLIARIQERSGGRLLVSTSFGGGSIPPEEVIDQADYVLVHGNNQGVQRIRGMVRRIRSLSSTSQPIVFNEDSTDLAKLEAAVSEGASWGYHDKGENDYRNGLQAPPVDWSINTAPKRAFFGRVAELAGLTPSPTAAAPGTTTVSSSAHRLLVSTSPDRSAPVDLDGLAVSEDIYPFTSPDTADIVRVSFWLNDPTMSGTPRQVEGNAPYDFAGGTVSAAAPFATTTVADGEHTITAKVELADGTSQVISATFRVENGP